MQLGRILTLRHDFSTTSRMSVRYAICALLLTYFFYITFLKKSCLTVRRTTRYMIAKALMSDKCVPELCLSVPGIYGFWETGARPRCRLVAPSAQFRFRSGGKRERAVTAFRGVSLFRRRGTGAPVHFGGRSLFDLHGLDSSQDSRRSGLWEPVQCATRKHRACEVFRLLFAD